LHARQAPVQALLQQYPSAQKVLAQSAPIEQVWPCRFLQVPFGAPTHWCVEMQSLSVWQLWRHAPLAHL
jgi:hypothetical protein